jgi:DNA-binding MurR/RpiR family transcriptional regulator
MARAALKLSVRDLAKLAHVATGTIVRIRHALEKAGVEFTNGDKPGVRLK